MCDGKLNSLLTKAPGEGTGPVGRIEFQGIYVGRVPTRGVLGIFQPLTRDTPCRRRGRSTSRRLAF